MKFTEVTEAEPIVGKGRKAAPNPFLEQATLDQFKTGQTFRINLDDDDKANTVVNQMRAAADTINHRVSIALDEDQASYRDVTDAKGKKVPGEKVLTNASTFRIKWVPRKEDKGSK